MLKESYMKKQEVVYNLFLKIVGLFILILCVMWGGINWETNDDPFIAFILGRYGAETTPWTNPLYALFLSVFYSKVMFVNWWFLFSMIGILVSIIILEQIVCSRIKERKLRCVVYSLIVIATYFFALRQMNFTRTACYIANAGCILLIAVWKEKQSIRKMIGIIGALIIYIWGTCIRFQSGLLIIPFAFSILLFDDYQKRRLKPIFRSFLSILFCIVIAIIGMQTSSNELKQWNERSSNLRVLLDYPYRIQHNLEWEELNKDGYYLEDIDFLSAWYVGDREIIDNEYLRYINGVVSKDISREFLINAICNMLKFSSMIWFFITAVLLMINFSRKIMVCYVGEIIICAVSLLLMGRIPNRVFESILFVGACDMIICMCLNVRIEVWNIKKNIFRECGWLEKIALIGMLFLAILEVSRGNLQYTFNRNAYYNTSKSIDIEILKYIDQDQEHIYYVPMSLLEKIAYQDCILYNADKDFCRNMIPWNGWIAGLPCYNNIWKENHISNQMRALYENDKLISVYSNDILSYLQRHYSENISFDTVFEADEYSFGRYIQ